MGENSKDKTIYQKFDEWLNVMIGFNDKDMGDPTIGRPHTGIIKLVMLSFIFVLIFMIITGDLSH